MDNDKLVRLLRDASAIIEEGGYGLHRHKVCGELQAAADELEKADSVGHMEHSEDKTFWWIQPTEYGRSQFYFGQKLYTTPPAPQVPDRVREATERAIAFCDQDFVRAFPKTAEQHIRGLAKLILAATPQAEPSRPLKEVVEDFERNQKFAAAIKDGRIWVKSAPQPGES